MLAGAAYVPLDAAWPDRRIDQITEQCSLAVLCEPGGPIDDLLADPVAWLPSTALPAAINPSPDDTAYVIFTSGSTGTPKGVMVSHRAAVNTVDDINDRLNVCAKDAVLAVSQHTFDLSVYNIFGILTAGGAIVFAEGGARNDPQAWFEAVTKHVVTVWNSVPAQMQLLLEQSAIGRRYQRCARSCCRVTGFRFLSPSRSRRWRRGFDAQSRRCDRSGDLVDQLSGEGTAVCPQRPVRNRDAQPERPCPDPPR